MNTEVAQTTQQKRLEAISEELEMSIARLETLYNNFSNMRTYALGEELGTPGSTSAEKLPIGPGIIGVIDDKIHTLNRIINQLDYVHIDLNKL